MGSFMASLKLAFWGELFFARLERCKMGSFMASNEDGTGSLANVSIFRHDFRFCVKIDATDLSIQ